MQIIDLTNDAYHDVLNTKSLMQIKNNYKWPLSSFINFCKGICHSAHTFFLFIERTNEKIAIFKNKYNNAYIATFKNG